MIYYGVNGSLNVSNNIKVSVLEFCPRFEKEWEFPKDKFVEYEPSDEKWARRLGFGKEVKTDRPAIFMVKNKPFEFEMIIHPDSFTKIKEFLEKRVSQRIEQEIFTPRLLF